MTEPKKTSPKSELIVLIKSLIKSPELKQEIQDKETKAVMEKILKFIDKMQQVGDVSKLRTEQLISKNFKNIKVAKSYPHAQTAFTLRLEKFRVHGGEKNAGVVFQVCGGGLIETNHVKIRVYADFAGGVRTDS